jgi:hypothetical protein
MTDTDRADESTDLAEKFESWGGVVVETLGAVLCCLGVIAIDHSHLLAYVLVAVGAPLVVLGTVLIGWSTK